MDENVCSQIRLVDNILQAKDFIRLRIEVGLVEVPVDHARKVLQNGIINVSAIYNGELIGMGRDCAATHPRGQKKCWKEHTCR